MSDEIKRGKGRPPVEVPMGYIDEIVRVYNNGGSIREAANAGHIGVVIAKRILTERGITIRGKKMA